MTLTREMKWHPDFTENDNDGLCRCCLCGKRIKNRKLYIHVGYGGELIIHADAPTTPDGAALLPLEMIEKDLQEERIAHGLVVNKDPGDIGWFEVGADCAKKLGAGWSKELEPLALW